MRVISLSISLSIYRSIDLSIYLSIYYFYIMRLVAFPSYGSAHYIVEKSLNHSCIQSSALLCLYLHLYLYLSIYLSITFTCICRVAFSSIRFRSLHCRNPPSFMHTIISIIPQEYTQLYLH